MSGNPVKTARIALIDDHEVVREGLARMLSACADIDIVASFGTGEEALRCVPDVQPDLVLLDLSLPGMPGLHVLRALKSLRPTPHVLVLTVHDDEDLVLGAAKLGAEGYVLKQASRAELTTAIRTVTRGGHYFSAEVVDLFRGNKCGHDRATQLTKRELEVLRLLALGMSNRDIATHLFLSADTVKTHLGNVYRKLGAEGRAHAVAMGLRQGLLE